MTEINWGESFKKLLQAIAERCDSNTYTDIVDYFINENNMEDNEIEYIEEVARNILYEAYDSEIGRYIPDDIELAFTE